jgi:hypothetical protein
MGDAASAGAAVVERAADGGAVSGNRNPPSRSPGTAPAVEGALPSGPPAKNSIPWLRPGEVVKFSSDAGKAAKKLRTVHARPSVAMRSATRKPQGGK